MSKASQVFDKVLVANRGEIAVRVIRTLRELDIEAVAVYSEPDRDGLHVRMADEAYCVGPAPSTASYLDIDTILDVARQSDVDAIHPGYGFLSENPEFADAVRTSDFVFVGPQAHSIAKMGEKTQARDIMRQAGVPVVPGTKDAIADTQKGKQRAEEIGFPVLLKPASGGGGKGMSVVQDASEFEEAFETAQRQARNAFNDERVYLEKYLVNPKHIEIQVLADQDGNTIHLFERECSVQRRHQKVLEETPAVVMDDETRHEMGQVAVRAAEAVDYEGAGTVEFLLDEDKSFYFLEMNTRLQVEHPITEMTTGVDLVYWQLEVAAGRQLELEQDELEQNGYAIECRIYAEDPWNQFRPSPGPLTRLQEPSGPGVRVDSGVYEGDEITPHYDPMISKLVVWGPTRDQAIRRMKRALREYKVEGTISNIDFHKELLEHPPYVEGTYNTRVLDEKPVEKPALDAFRDEAKLAALLAKLRKDEQLRSGSTSDHQTNQDRKISNWRKYGRFKQLGSGWQ